MKITPQTCLLLLFLWPLPMLADSLVAVNGLNYPVWMERQGQREALSPDMALMDGDVVITGASGRVWLSMADGSVVKLGQSATFRIDSVDYDRQQDRDIMTATLNVIKGAFRFTTSFFKPRRKTPHQVNIKIGAITAGLRGTDIWGRSSDSEDFVTLLEGSVMIEAEGEGRAVLSQPLTLYVKKRGRPADPLGRVQEQQVPILAAETELSEQLGIVDAKGRYELVLLSSRNEIGILRQQRRIRQQGFYVHTVPVEIGGETYYRLVLPGLISLQSASDLSQRLQYELGLKGVWVNNSPR